MTSYADGKGADVLRMWMVDPALMCNQHLLGEHLEIHMLQGSIQKGKNLRGFLENGLLEPSSIRDRHRAIVEEMIRRGFNHNSPIEGKIDPGYLGVLALAKVDREASSRELAARCKKCRKKIGMG